MQDTGLLMLKKTKDPLLRFLSRCFPILRQQALLTTATNKKCVYKFCNRFFLEGRDILLRNISVKHHARPDVVTLNSSGVNTELNPRFRKNGYRHHPGGGLQTTGQAVQNECSHRGASEEMQTGVWVRWESSPELCAQLSYYFSPQYARSVCVFLVL